MATGSARAVGYACALGTWRSLVAHLLWEQGVAGSNPAVPMRVKLMVTQILPLRRGAVDGCG